jgi:hypothetical protein
MSAEPLGTKTAANLTTSDRICYTAGMVEYNTFGGAFTPLSGEVRSITDVGDGTYIIFTTSGRLKPVTGDTEFEIIGPDYEQGVVQSIWWREAETFSGVSIE